MSVPACRFYFDVLTYHVVAEVFRLLQVINQCFICRCSIQTVRPPSLVERTELEIVFVVQLQASDAILTFADRIFTHSRITLYLVYCFSVFIQSHFHVVEERRVRRPQFSISRHCQFNRYSVQRCTFGYKVLAIEYFYFYFVCRGRISGNFYLNRIIVNIRSRFQISDVLCCYRFQPHCLPDTCNRSVPNAMRICYLLSSGLFATI